MKRDKATLMYHFANRIPMKVQVTYDVFKWVILESLEHEDGSSNSFNARVQDIISTETFKVYLGCFN